MHSEEFNAVDTLHDGTTDANGCVLTLFPSVVHIHFLSFVHIEKQAVVFAQVHYVFYLLPLRCFIIIADEVHNCHVVRKFTDVLCVRFARAVLCQQCKQQWTEHLGAQHDEVLLTTRTVCHLSVKKSRIQLQVVVVQGCLGWVVMSCVAL